MAGIQRRIERTARRRKRARVPRGRVLSALTTSTLALPGLAGSSELGDLGYTTEYRYSRYTEGDLPASKVQAGNEVVQRGIDHPSAQSFGCISEPQFPDQLERRDRYESIVERPTVTARQKAGHLPGHWSCIRRGVGRSRESLELVLDIGSPFTLPGDNDFALARFPFLRHGIKFCEMSKSLARPI
jgi:hypothetical protein